MLERGERAGPAAAQASAEAAGIPTLDTLAVPKRFAGLGERHSKTVNLDLAQLQAAGYLVPGAARSQMEEEFRVIKRPLLKNIHESKGSGRTNLIMVTSAVPGEGKTFTAVNLALSMAMELDHTVLLVDADVLRPSAMERLGLQNGKGLLDVLSNPELDLSEVLLKTNVPKLVLMPAGTPNLASTEMMASTTMEQLLDEMAQYYSDRVVIFDAPPLLPSTESRVLASRVGQVVMVVEAGSTTKGAVTQAFAAVEQCPIVMSVLNKCRSLGPDSRYGYYGY